MIVRIYRLKWSIVRENSHAGVEIGSVNAAAFMASNCRDIDKDRGRIDQRTIYVRPMDYNLKDKT